MAKKNKSGSPGLSPDRCAAGGVVTTTASPSEAIAHKSQGKAASTEPVNHPRTETELQEDDWISLQLPTFD